MGGWVGEWVGKVRTGERGEGDREKQHDRTCFCLFNFVCLYCHNELAASEAASMLAASLLARQHFVLHVTALIMIHA